MEILKFCRLCEMKVKEVCSHPLCLAANAQGFCCPGCQRAYFEIKDFELRKASGE